MIPFLWFTGGLLLGGVFVVAAKKGWKAGKKRESKTVADILIDHFSPVEVDDITLSEREFPFRVRADLQRALDRIVSENLEVIHFFGVRREYAHDSLKLTDCLIESEHYPARSVPPEYEEIDIGDETPDHV